MNKIKIFPLLFSFSISFFILCILGTWQLNKNYTIKKKNSFFNKEINKKSNNIIDFSKKISDLTFINFEGERLYEKTVFLEPRTYNNLIGYHEITVYKIDNQMILVNKGFVREKNIIKENKGKEKIEGLIIKIPKPKFFELKNDIKNNTWYSLDLFDLSNFFNLKLVSYLVYEQKNHEDVSRISVTPNLVSNVNHLQYAFTWYFLCVTLCVIFFIYFNKNRYE